MVEQNDQIAAGKKALQNVSRGCALAAEMLRTASEAMDFAPKESMQMAKSAVEVMRVLVNGYDEVLASGPYDH